MKVIFVGKEYGTSRAVTFGRWSGALLSLCLLGLPLGGFGLAYLWIQDDAESTTLDMLRQEVGTHAQAVAGLRAETDRQLLSLGTTLAEMEARMVRLDAMGQRLTDLAGLDDGEFDFRGLPGLGGPLDVGSGDSDAETHPVSLTGEMNNLQTRIADREYQLELLAALLANRQLEVETYLSGRPTNKGWLSSYFGWRKDPFNGKKSWHQGVDFAGKLGSDVIAVASGVVTWSGDRDGYGNMIEISHGGGYSTRYAHNKKNLARVGDIVKKGQVIARMGSSGRSTGPHVHFEVHKHGRPVDPARYVRRNHR